MRHTPGPWHVDSTHVRHAINTNDVHIAMGNIGPGLTEDEGIANANLIAAAPELLDALQWLDTAIMPEERKYDEWGYCRIHRSILCIFDAVVKEAIATAKPEVKG